MTIIKEESDWNNVLIPDILYKYRDWNNTFHQSILKENILYFSSPAKFQSNDYYDFNIPIKYPKTDEEIFAYIFKNNVGRIKYENYNDYVEACKRILKTSPLKNKEERKNIAQEIKEAYFNIHGVLSLSANSKNKYLWDNYANKYSGFCVGFDMQVLKNNIQFGGGRVNYYKKLPIRDLINDDLETVISKEFFSKREKFKEEEEFRLTITYGRTASEDDRKKKFPNEAIKKVILGQNMHSEHKNEIKGLVENKFINAEIIEL